MNRPFIHRELKKRINDVAYEIEAITDSEVEVEITFDHDFFESNVVKNKTILTRPPFFLSWMSQDEREGLDDSLVETVQITILGVKAYSMEFHKVCVFVEEIEQLLEDIKKEKGIE